ncbi:hypothetical protein Vretimale_8048 [Volvox reticuliferus]|nr:hypothetical protein Vretimale_8048 [Volvox reticuliferus]
MYESVDSPSRISFFEPKLDFWRQLWRVLERSDVAIVIVDARNPLLHFSEALAHHVMDDHGIPALLVLNKCDLVPASCVEQWRRFFERRYPGLKVVASSASAAGGREAAEAIMDAVLDCVVTRDGQRVKVSEVVQMTRDEVLVASKARNTHSKRNRPQPINAPQQQPQEQQQQQAAGEASGAEGGSGADPETGAELGMEGSGRGGGVAGDGWELKGNKSKKKEAVRRKRNQRMHGGVGGGTGGGSACAAGTATSTAAGGGRHARGRNADTTAAGTATLGPQGVGLAARSRRDRATNASPETAGADAEGEGEKRDEDGRLVDVEERLAVEEEADGGSVSDGPEDAAASVAGDDDDNDNVAFDKLVEDEDEEGFLHEDVSSDGGEEEEDGASISIDGASISVGGDTVTGTPAWGGHGARGGRDRRGRSRPVVVCVVGEPNVGKSSTMNALLGAKRVAVSSHPGRTKHYQTHVMCSGLMLCDCPGLVFPRLDVSLYMQVLFGSYPIARCRDPYAVVRYLAERVWPRLHRTLGLRPVTEDEEELKDEGGRAGKDAAGCGRGQRLSDQQEWRDADWTPLALCEALAARHNWRSRRGGRLDVYRAANWILRSALAGRNAVNVAFLPPEDDAGGCGDGSIGGVTR